jgi:hypothetical protein
MSDTISTNTATAENHASQIQSVTFPSVPTKVSISSTNISDISFGASLNVSAYSTAAEASTDITAYGKDISAYTQSVIAEDNRAGVKISGVLAP